MVRHLANLVVGFVVGLLLVGLGTLVVDSAAHPLAREAWQAECWQLTKPLLLQVEGAAGPSIPEGTEFAWDGELAWVTVYLEGDGFERCDHGGRLSKGSGW